MVASANPVGISGTPAPASSSPYPLASVKTPPIRENQSGDVPRRPPPAVEDAGALDMNGSLPGSKQVQDTPWISGSDEFDFSGLYYDYGPLGPLQERLEPFRLPESTYLFGSETVW